MRRSRVLRRNVIGRKIAVAALAAAGIAGTAAQAEEPAARTETAPFDHTQHQMMPSANVAGTSYEAATPPLWDDLGGISMPVATTSPLAQRYFDQGLRLAYGFNHAEARRAFRRAQALDPGCAMCYWGEALVLGPNINAPMTPEAAAPAMAALRQAQALASESPPREQALIEALAARYSDDPAADRGALDRAYADAMAHVAARFPEDRNITVLYAEAMMDTQPWDYWETDGHTPKGFGGEIVAALERVLAEEPDHFGAIHLYIHAVEASTSPERAEPYADGLAAMDLGTGHLVHMPSHIYYRVGRYLDALEANRRAVATDEAYVENTGAVGLYPSMYYPHNVHFLMASAQLAGDGRTVIEAARKLDRIVPYEAARAVPLAQPIKAALYFAHAQYSPPDAILSIAAPPEDMPYLAAMWHYARGVAQVTKGDLAAARMEADAIAEIGRTADFSNLSKALIPGSEVVGLAHRVVLARIAQAEGDLDAAIDHLKTAAATEEGLIYMEPPYWYYPVSQTLGATLLQAGRVDEAQAAFEAALAKAPNSGWALYGLKEVAESRNDRAMIEDMEARLNRAWIGDRSLLELGRL